SYRVRATNSIRDSGYTHAVPASTLATSPAATSGLTATTLSSSQISLSWTDNSNNETGFKIERTTGAGSFTEIGTVGAGITNYSEIGRASCRERGYSIGAYNSVGKSSYTIWATTT